MATSVLGISLLLYIDCHSTHGHLLPNTDNTCYFRYLFKLYNLRCWFSVMIYNRTAVTWSNYTRVKSLAAVLPPKLCWKVQLARLFETRPGQWWTDPEGYTQHIFICCSTKIYDDSTNSMTASGSATAARIITMLSRIQNNMLITAVSAITTCACSVGVDIIIPSIIIGLSQPRLKYYTPVRVAVGFATPVIGVSMTFLALLATTVNLAVA